MPIIYDKKLKIARAIANRHDPTQEELKLARKMAQDGCSFEEIKIALKWTCKNNTAASRLKKFNIFSRRRASGIGGQFSGHANFNADKNGINMKTYKPKNKS